MKVLFPALLLLLSGLAACGQTGPLHLPQDAPAKENYLLGKRKAPPAAALAAPAAVVAPAAEPVAPEASSPESPAP